MVLMVELKSKGDGSGVEGAAKEGGKGRVRNHRGLAHDGGR